MRDELQTVLDLWGHPGFQGGLVAGVLGLGLLFIVALIVERPTFGWGAVFSIAAGVGLIQSEIEIGVLVRLGLLVASGLLVDLAPNLNRRWGLAPKTVAWAAVTVVAVLVSIGMEMSGPAWISFAFPATVVALAAGLWMLGRSPDAELVGPLMALCIAGAWATVPETDEVVVMLGAAIPMGLATLRPLRGRPSAAGALALAGVFAWLVVQGGAPRPWTIAASLAAAATIPLIAAMTWRVGRPRPILAGVVHVVYVVAMTRVADYTDSVLAVSFWLAGLVVLAGLTLVLVPTKSRETTPGLSHADMS